MAKKCESIAVTLLAALGNQHASGTQCVCGHPLEEHGGDTEYPESTACVECGCIAYEADCDR